MIGAGRVLNLTRAVEAVEVAGAKVEQGVPAVLEVRAAKRTIN